MKCGGRSVNKPTITPCGETTTAKGFPFSALGVNIHINLCHSEECQEVKALRRANETGALREKRARAKRALVKHISKPGVKRQRAIASRDHARKKKAAVVHRAQEHDLCLGMADFEMRLAVEDNYDHHLPRAKMSGVVGRH